MSNQTTTFFVRKPEEKSVELKLDAFVSDGRVFIDIRNSATVSERDTAEIVGTILRRTELVSDTLEDSGCRRLGTRFASLKEVSELFSRLGFRCREGMVLARYHKTVCW